nr:PREDICTED: uncharacterized protein LOC109040485 isoform X1 [Bemisia tabaci]
MAELWKKAVKKATKKKKQRNLWIIYRQHYDDTDFNYRVKDGRGRLAFGSSGIRDCANPFNYGTSRLAIDKRSFNAPQLGPGKYDVKCEELFPQYCSLSGYGGLARRAQRFAGETEAGKEKKPKVSGIPSIYEYSPDICCQSPRRTNDFTWPFRAQYKPFEWSKRSSVPEAGLYYDGIIRKQSLQYSHCFGGKKRLNHHVLVKCQPYNIDECTICGEALDAQDYWVASGNFLCLTCMAEQRVSHSHFSQLELQKFEKIRSCSFMHSHEGTTAKIPLKSNKELSELMYHECYFSSYFDESKSVIMKPRTTGLKRKYGGRINFIGQLKIQPLKIP